MNLGFSMNTPSLRWLNRDIRISNYAISWNAPFWFKETIKMFVPLVVLGVAIVMMVWEAASPGRSWPQVSGWWLRAALVNCVQASMVFLFGHAWRDWLIQHRLWSADCLGVVGGSVVGYLVFTFLYYWWHRWRHESPIL